MKTNHLLATILKAVFSFEGTKANTINRTEGITMAVEAFTFLQMNSFFD
jgi:hypothetical protein